MSESSSYKTALKSTSLIGGASLINILIGMVRTKFVAILLGPAGVGLMGVYSAIIGMVSTVSSMGIGTSGTRQIAEACGAGDLERLARTVKTLRRTVWATGVLGMFIMVLGCTAFSKVSFGTASYALPIAILGVTILLANLAVGQSCILQGTRRIGDLTKVSIVGALNGTIISIPCYYFWRTNGIVLGVILTGTAALATSWWFSRRVPLVPVAMSWSESGGEASKLLHFGIPLMLSGFIKTLSGFLIRSLLVRMIGLVEVGLWQAAFNFSGILVNFVLAAMGTDYYPRLSALSHDNQKMNQAVNEQAEIALLMSVPGLAATIIFAPWVIGVFYSGKFDGAVDILRWSVYGIFGQLLVWPLGYVLGAKAMGKTIVFLEAVNAVIYLASVWICLKTWGFLGAGVAFFVAYLFYLPLAYTVVYFVAGTKWTAGNKIHILVFTVLLALIGLVSAFVANPWIQFPINLVALALMSVYCLRRLSSKSGVTLCTLRAKFLHR